MGLKLNSNKLDAIVFSRNHLESLVPFNGSMISFDLLIILADHYFDGKSLTQKELFASLPYSMMSCRQHLIRLVKEELIYFEIEKNDFRKKRIIYSPRLQNHFDLLYPGAS